jgi:hypothetical protein
LVSASLDLQRHPEHIGLAVFFNESPGRQMVEIPPWRFSFLSLGTPKKMPRSSGPILKRESTLSPSATFIPPARPRRGSYPPGTLNIASRAVSSAASFSLAVSIDSEKRALRLLGSLLAIAMLPFRSVTSCQFLRIRTRSVHPLKQLARSCIAEMQSAGCLENQHKTSSTRRDRDYLASRKEQ